MKDGEEEKDEGWEEEGEDEDDEGDEGLDHHPLRHHIEHHHHTFHFDIGENGMEGGDGFSTNTMHCTNQQTQSHDGTRTDRLVSHRN